MYFTLRPGYLMLLNRMFWVPELEKLAVEYQNKFLTTSIDDTNTEDTVLINMSGAKRSTGHIHDNKV